MLQVKGVMATNFTEEELEAVPRQWRHLYNRVWDVTDFVVMMMGAVTMMMMMMMVMMRCRPWRTARCS